MMAAARNVREELDRIRARLSDEKFLANKGLSNEVGIHIYCYEPEEELIVREFVAGITPGPTEPFRIIERNLYSIFLQILEEKSVLHRVTDMEEKRGKDFLLRQLQKIATPDVFVQKMDYPEHRYGDVLFITGIGTVFPFIRAHVMLNAIQVTFSDIPVVAFYPGTFNGSSLHLFSRFFDENYYRAFNLL